MKRSNLYAPLLILVVSFALHFIWFSRPPSVVFDEVHYGRFALSYLRHEFVFDIHPPLGRLLLWAAAWFANLDPHFSFAAIGMPFPDSSYLALRLPPRLAGMLLPLVIYGVALELGMSRWLALTVGLLVACDNALLVISRFALVDVFILFFGFAALWAYLRERRLNSWTWLFGAAVAAGLALSVKWTGLAFLGIIGALQLIELLSERSASNLGKLLLLGLVPAVIYVGTFAAEFALSNRSGRDDAFMSPAFQATLVDSRYAEQNNQSKLGFVGKFIELNSKMYSYAQQASDHPYRSKWYSWPFMTRGIFFWTKSGSTKEADIYLLGNPVIWWVSAYAIIFLLVNFPPKIPALIAGSQPPPVGRAELTILFGYLASMLSFVGIPRGMFLYHYLPALIFAILAVGLLLDRVEQKRGLGLALLAASACGFVYFAPLSYGLPMPKAALERMFWLEGWR